MLKAIKGVQNRILESNESAIFSPSGAFSLNRVNGAKLNADVMTFFGHVASLYSFFPRSPACWEVLKKHIPLSVSYTHLDVYKRQV